MRRAAWSVVGLQKRWIVNLSADERASLEQVVRRDRVAGVKRTRAMILLRADEGLVDEAIAEQLDVARVTVERVRRRCCERGVHECLDRKTSVRMSRPRKFDGASGAELVRIACSSAPVGRTS